MLLYEVFTMKKYILKINPDRIDGLVRIGGFMYPLFITYL